MDFLKHSDDEDDKSTQPVSFNGDENEYIQNKFRNSNKKDKHADKNNGKSNSEYPVLGGGTSAGPMIITEKKNELEVRFGIKINKSKKGRR